MSQLDLFIHFKKPADVHLFPLHRRTILAREIAAVLSAVDHAAGKRHWQERCKELRLQLRKQGLSTDTIRVEIAGLADAVHDELRVLPFPKQIKRTAVVVSLSSMRRNTFPHCDGSGVAGAVGQGPKVLVGLGEAHESYDAARAYDGGDAA